MAVRHFSVYDDTDPTLIEAAGATDVLLNSIQAHDRATPRVSMTVADLACTNDFQ